MLIDSLREFERAYNNLWKDIRDQNEKDLFILNNITDEYISILENLIKIRVFQLNAFEIMLHVSPDRALGTLKDWYLSLDLSNHIKDPVSDLDIMLSDIKDVIGKNKLEELLNDPDFLSVNKKNPRVKEAFDFAMDND
ncbi:hypothetical protein [Pectobacterium parmentieri]|uniref:hypothetical protein n=1 Tax=Pectobacterium parmentieri TaxID=1905730 RepID=UPI000473C9C7|nr:hypothetical protein [Pectobacterium parmentieri]